MKKQTKNLPSLLQQYLKTPQGAHQAIGILNQFAKYPGDHLIFGNQEEEGLLKARGGVGTVNPIGVRQYGLDSGDGHGGQDTGHGGGNIGGGGRSGNGGDPGKGFSGVAGANAARAMAGIGGMTGPGGSPNPNTGGNAIHPGAGISAGPSGIDPNMPGNPAAIGAKLAKGLGLTGPELDNAVTQANKAYHNQVSDAQDIGEGPFNSIAKAALGSLGISETNPNTVPGLPGQAYGEGLKDAIAGKPLGDPTNAAHYGVDPVKAALTVGGFFNPGFTAAGAIYSGLTKTGLINGPSIDLGPNVLGPDANTSDFSHGFSIGGGFGSSGGTTQRGPSSQDHNGQGPTGLPPQNQQLAIDPVSGQPSTVAPQSVGLLQQFQQPTQQQIWPGYGFQTPGYGYLTWS